HSTVHSNGDLSRQMDISNLVVRYKNPQIVEFTFQFGFNAFQLDVMGSCVQHHSSGHTPGQTVKDIFNRISAFVVAQQDRRLTVVVNKRFHSGIILFSSAVEVVNDTAVMAALYPLIANAKFEFRK